MTHSIHKPALDSLPEYYRGYVAPMEGEDLIESLRAEQILLRDMLRPLNEDRALHRYAEGKWSIKELLSHLLDAEWIFCYRALCFARGERQSLPGFEENDYVVASKADGRSLSSLVEEMEHLRNATINMFSAFDQEQLDRVGQANAVPLSVRGIGWIIAGHGRHHREVLQERYL